MENTTPVSLIACVTHTQWKKDTRLSSATTKQRESLMLGVILLSFSFGFLLFLSRKQPTNQHEHHPLSPKDTGFFKTRFRDGPLPPSVVKAPKPWG